MYRAWNTTISHSKLGFLGKVLILTEVSPYHVTQEVISTLWYLLFDPLNPAIVRPLVFLSCIKINNSQIPIVGHLSEHLKAYISSYSNLSCSNYFVKCKDRFHNNSISSKIFIWLQKLNLPLRFIASCNINQYLN